VRGFNAATLSANADLHALSNQHRDAVHEMWHTDEVGPHEPRGPNFDLLTYRCIPCDSGESFLKAM
jgi:hypothetical protein